MRRRFLQLALLCFLPLLFSPRVFAQNSQRDSIFLLSVNDIHAAMTQFPRFAYMVDSLRNLHPSLLVVGAGDYNSGNPLNDYYDPAGYPVIALMNAVGFDISTVGNHEFDVGQSNFGLMTRTACFPFLAANVFPDEKFGIKLEPYLLRALPNGKKIAFVGMLQIEEDGLPSTHHDKVKGIRFTSAHEELPKYRFLRDSADLVVLVSHLGIEDDRVIARNNQWLDLIIGGHSHTYLDGAETVGETYLTQSENKLHYASLTTIAFDGNRKVSTTIQTFPIKRTDGLEKTEVRKMLDWFSQDPYYNETIATASNHFKNQDQLGYLMCDAYRSETGSDFSFQNFGGVRMDNFLKGPIKVLDVFILDPFGNEMMTVELTGQEIVDFVRSAWEKDLHEPIYTSGLHLNYYIDKDDRLLDLKITDEEENPLDPNQLYKVAYSNYIASAYPFRPRKSAIKLGKTTAEVTIEYLRKKRVVEDYDAKPSRINLIRW